LLEIYVLFPIKGYYPLTFIVQDIAKYGRCHMLESLKHKARLLKTEVYTISLAYKDPRVPWYARILAVCVVGYAFSPIDLIPDPIPIIGYLDDLIFVPLGIALVLKMIPNDVMDECREQAKVAILQNKPVNWMAAIAIVGIWVGLAILSVAMVSKYFIA
jgi:uncharacterized membrane protein YkvA (DUF1232 family)